MNSINDVIAELNQRSDALRRSMETAMQGIRTQHNHQIKQLVEKQESEKNNLMALVVQHLSEKKGLLAVQKQEIEDLDNTISALSGKKNVSVPTIRNMPIAVTVKQEKVTLPQKILRIMQNHDRSSDIQYLFKVLKRDYSWMGSYQHLSITLSAKCGLLWRRIGRGRYATIPNRTVSPLKGMPANVVFAQKYPMPVVEMVLKAVQEAKNGKPVVKSDIQDYITKRWATNFNMKSITPAIYSKLVPSGKVKKLGDGVFQAVG